MAGAARDTAVSTAGAAGEGAMRAGEGAAYTTGAAVGATQVGSTLAVTAMPLPLRLLCRSAIVS